MPPSGTPLGACQHPFDTSRSPPMLATQTEDLLQQDREHAVHPLQFSTDQDRTTIFVEAKAPSSRTARGTSSSTDSPVSGTSTSAMAAKSSPKPPPSRC